MARTASITLEQVAKAAETLRAGGKTPGVRNVREVLGTGSNQTIQALLIEWQNQQPAVALPATLAASEGFMQAVASELARVQTLTTEAYEMGMAEAVAARDAAMVATQAQFDENELLRAQLAEQAKALYETQGKAAALEKQVQDMQELEAAKAFVEQRAAAAEAKVALLESRAKEADELRAAALATAKAHEKALQEQAEVHAKALAARDAEALKLRDAGAAQGSELREKEKALHAALARGDELAKQAAGMKESEAARAQAEQRAAVAEAKLSIQEPRAALVDGLQQRISELVAQLPKPEEKTAQKPHKG